MLCNLLTILVQVSSSATSSKKRLRSKCLAEARLFTTQGQLHVRKDMYGSLLTNIVYTKLEETKPCRGNTGGFSCFSHVGCRPRYTCTTAGYPYSNCELL